ncbi:MAG: diguanylate cyclase [Candidatus Limnocylindrales bacterium]
MHPLQGPEAGSYARLPWLLAAAAASVTVLLLLVEFVATPGSQLPARIALTAAIGVTLVAAVVLLRRDEWAYGLDIAGAVLMLLGIAAGALLPDGLDAAAILPLTGAVLTLPKRSGLRLGVVFMVAFAASLAGETAAYVYGMRNVTSLVNWPQSLAESGVMLAFSYGLVWWAGDRWWSATARAQHVQASQRRLLEINELLLSTLDPAGVLGLIADSLKPVLPYDNLTIYRVDRHAGVVRPVVARDRFSKLILSTTFPIDMGVTGWVVANGEAQCVNDIHLDKRAATIPGTPDEPESLIVVPLRVRGEVTGTLNVGRMGGTEAHFSEAEFDLARLFAGQASIAIQNAEIHRAVRNRAETDSLTGLHNRGAFDERLATLIAVPTAQPFALIMVDLDGFKDYNDRHGHPAGDEVLQAVGRAIDSAVRGRDLAFRYGGDEFAILIPRTELQPAVQVADRVRRTISKLAPMVAWTMTASAGVACHPIDGATAAALVGAADAALYRAKELGGNRTEICARGATPAADRALV